MIVHQAESNDNHRKFHAGAGLAEGNPVHPGDELPDTGKQDTVLESHGGTVVIMGCAFHSFFRQRYLLILFSGWQFIPNMGVSSQSDVFCRFFVFIRSESCLRPRPGTSFGQERGRFLSLPPAWDPLKTGLRQYPVFTPCKAYP